MPMTTKKEISITKDILYDWGDFNIGWNLDDTEFLFPSQMRKYVKIKDCLEGIYFMTKKVV